jgi:RNA polymerase primary sigma factor
MKKQSVVYYSDLRYFADVRRCETLTNDQIVELWHRMKAGEQSLREKIINANLRLVITIAKQYVGMGCEIADLISAGNVGLCEAVDKFDPNRGCFSLCAAYYIKHQIRKFLSENTTTLSVPVRYWYYFREIKMEAYKESPRSDEEMAKALKLSLNQYKTAKHLAEIDVSSNEEGIGEELKLGDLLKGDLEADVLLESKERKEAIKRAVSRLPEKKRQVIEMLYGLKTGFPINATDVARHLGISKQTVYSWSESGLKKLKRELAV